MSAFHSGVAFGVELFLIADMGIIHQLLHLHGVLFSNYFEIAILVVSASLVTKSLISRKWSFGEPGIQYGIPIGAGGTLFLDVFLVDQILKLHSVNYLASINVDSGIIGLLVAAAGLYGWLRNRHRI